jgi:hypothetical protein
MPSKPAPIKLKYAIRPSNPLSQLEEISKGINSLKGREKKPERNSRLKKLEKTEDQLSA